MENVILKIILFYSIYALILIILTTIFSCFTIGAKNVWYNLIGRRDLADMTKYNEYMDKEIKNLRYKLNSKKIG